MAPTGPQTRRPPADRTSQQQLDDEDDDGVNTQLFIDPMLGSPLHFYVEKDVPERANLVALISKHGGAVSQGYSGVPYLLVDPHNSSGQSLYRLYAGKKGKIVLSYSWIEECIKEGSLQTFHNDWAGCKVDGTEELTTPQSSDSVAESRQKRVTREAQVSDPQSQSSSSNQPQTLPPAMLHQPNPTVPNVEMIHAPSDYPYFLDPIHAMAPGSGGVSHAWNDPSTTHSIEPSQMHVVAPQVVSRAPYQHDWSNYEHPSHLNAPAEYDYQYRTNWQYYGPSYPSYEQSDSYVSQEPIPEPMSVQQEMQPASPEVESERPRGRKRVRDFTNQIPKDPEARSPTPPSRVVKSTYGGNLFTADDVDYLKRYIDYCQQQDLVYSLREICERIAVRAPHHTFFSWRRYCNKHKVRLGPYSLNRSDSSSVEEEDADEEMPPRPSGSGSGSLDGALGVQHIQRTSPPLRNRSPSPPRNLLRSTTGKGVAFTIEDTNFLVSLLKYRRSQGRLDMVVFWKDVAEKAPHHSRQSWMKYWRRHKHELDRVDEDEDPLPIPPGKKMRYSREDDVLIAKFLATKPEGTLDKVFQDFGRQYQHHPWKGWQEHHRLHKAKIDYFIGKLALGQNIDEAEPGEASYDGTLK